MTATAVVRPLPGAGLVTRSGELLLVCADGAAGVEELLGLVAEVASSGGDGSVLVRRVAALLAADFAGRYPACAVSGPAGDGRLAVLVHGSALATIVGAEGEVVLSAADAITSVNRLVPGPISAVRLELPGAGTANPLSRLEAGVITAAGVVAGEAPDGPAPSWTPPQAAAPAVESVAWSASSIMDNQLAQEWPPRPAEEPPVPFPLTMDPPADPPPYPPYPVTDAPLADAPAADAPAATGPDEPVEEAVMEAEPAPAAPAYAETIVGEPEPPFPPPVYDEGPGPELREPDAGSPFVAVPLGGESTIPPAPPAADARPTVLGLVCANGHLTDPSAESCVTCGVSMAGAAPVLREGPRPPLGALLLDDGSAYVLDVDYLLGREPQTDPEVVGGTVRPLKIVDAEGVVSRKHVRVALVGWEIQVVDLGSANGTYVQFPHEMQAHPLVAHQPVVVRAGTQVTMGRRSFRVEALSPDV